MVQKDPDKDTMAQLIADAEAGRQQELVNLKARSKPLSELVATEYFTVDDVVGVSSAISFVPRSEMVFGGWSQEYQGGFTSRLLLQVSPQRDDLPVRVLTFDGISAVRAGDYISAQIPKYVETKISPSLMVGPAARDLTFYLARDFNQQESAIELAILDLDAFLGSGGKVLRRDRSVEYQKFVKA